MNEKLDLVKILRNCPKGTPLYSTIHGNVTLLRVIESETCVYPIELAMEGYNSRILSVTKYGLSVNAFPGECVLFPSKDQRDWSKFKAPVKKFDYSTLKPFDRVLVRDNDRDIWRCSLFTCFCKKQIVCEVSWEQGIPDNDETKHLVGTTDKPDEKYIWWE